jgi:neutral ceramidase
MRLCAGYHSAGPDPAPLLHLMLTAGIVAIGIPISQAVGARTGQPPRQLRAGAATSNITPRLGTSINGGMRDQRALHVHDELHARCLVLDNGQTRLAIAVCDSCMLPREVTDAARRLVREETGLPEDHILISATHAHSCGTLAAVFQSEPDAEYPRFVARRIADGIRRAINNLAPARIGWGAGQVPEEVFNRRWRMKPGSIPPNPFGGMDQVKMNPAVGSPDLLEPAGPTDPQVSVVSITSLDARPIALLANYSLHYVGGVGPGHLSADYYGIFADRIQQLLGADREDPPFVGIMSNGTSGDVNNINFRGPAERLAPYEKMRRVAGKVADEVLRVQRGIQHREWVPLAGAQSELKLGVRKPKPEEVARAREILAKAKPGPLIAVEEIYARETVQMADYPEQVSVILQALRIGDLGIAAIPCEVFAEIGLELKRRSPIQPMFTISLANGYHGYLPTPEQHALGGYETWRAKSSYLEVEASRKITARVLELLERVRTEG